MVTNDITVETTNNSQATSSGSRLVELGEQIVKDRDRHGRLQHHPPPSAAPSRAEGTGDRVAHQESTGEPYDRQDGGAPRARRTRQLRQGYARAQSASGEW